jgi:hypothetical protein
VRSRGDEGGGGVELADAGVAGLIATPTCIPERSERFHGGVWHSEIRVAGVPAALMAATSAAGSEVDSMWKVIWSAPA